MYSDNLNGKYWAIGGLELFGPQRDPDYRCPDYRCPDYRRATVTRKCLTLTFIHESGIVQN
jgi:hypothetical protein